MTHRLALALLLAPALARAAPSWLADGEDRGWTAEEIAIAETVAARLPPLPPGFRVVRRAGAAPERLGWTAQPEGDGAGTWFVYDGPADALPHALAHLAGHALDTGLSGDPTWRALAGWKRRLAAPLDAPVRAERGIGPHETWRSRASPAEELAEYAAAVFLAEPRDDAPARCDRPTRFRLLAAHLRASGWRSPLEEIACPSFERWIRPEAVEEIELLLAASSTNHPASLWGHLLLRVRHHDGAGAPPGLAPVFHLGGVETDGGFRQAWNGLTGDLEARLFLTPAHRIARIYRLAESRSLKRFPLRLDATKRRHLLERLWEASRDRARWRYSFFTDNCAGLLAELLAPALAPEIALDSPNGIRMPTATLDLFAAARRRDGGEPLLGFTGLEEGAADRAASAADVRRALAASLDPALAREAAARDPARRLAAYRALAETGPPEVVAGYLDASLDLETYAAWRAQRHPRGPGTVLSRLGDLVAAMPRAPAAPRVRAPEPGSVGDSGAYTVRVAAGERARTEVDLAVLEEALGERRDRGFRPDVSMRCLAVRLALARGRIEEHAWTFASFQTVRRELPELEAEPWRSVGFAARLAGFGVPARGVRGSALLEGGPSIALAASDDLSAHLVLQAIAGGGWVDGPGGPLAAATGEAALRARLPLGSFTLHRLEATLTARPLLAHDGRHGWLARAEASATLAAGDRARSPWQLRPLVRWETGPGLASGTATRASTAALVELTLPL